MFVLEELGPDGYRGLDQSGDPGQFQPVLNVFRHPGVGDGEFLGARLLGIAFDPGNFCGDRSVVDNHVVNVAFQGAIEVLVFQPVPKTSALNNPVVSQENALTTRSLIKQYPVQGFAQVGWPFQAELGVSKGGPVGVSVQKMDKVRVVVAKVGMSLR